MFDEIDAEIEKLTDFKLKQLHVDHAYAKSPKQRRLIEKKMQKLHDDLEDLRAKKNLVDLAYERWKRALLKDLKGPE